MARTIDGDLDLLVIGGGVMGLFTAYHASGAGFRVGVLERGRIGDPTTASFGRTRSYRKDYLDPVYARLAEDAMTLWSAVRARHRPRRARPLRMHERREAVGDTGDGPDLRATFDRCT